MSEQSDAIRELNDSIDEAMLSWWLMHPKRLNTVITRVVEFGVKDTYVDEVNIHSKQGLEIRLLTYIDPDEDVAIFEALVARLKVVLGSPVQLWLNTGDGPRIGDAIFN